MITATLSEAEANLSELVKRAQDGEEVVITSGEGEVPVARIVAMPVQSRRLGWLYDPNFVLPDSFWDPLPEEELRLWNGEGE